MPDDLDGGSMAASIPCQTHLRLLTQSLPLSGLSICIGGARYGSRAASPCNQHPTPMIYPKPVQYTFGERRILVLFLQIRERHEALDASRLGKELVVTHPSDTKQ